MLLRLNRDDRLNFVPDYIVSAATDIGALVTQDPTGVRKLIFVPGGKFADYEAKLQEFGRQDPWFINDAGVRTLLEGLQHCSDFYILSTTHEVVVASDNVDSRFLYRQLRDMENKLAPLAEQLRDQWTECLRDLTSLTA